MRYYFILITFFIHFVISSGIDACDTEHSGSDEYWYIPELSTLETIIGSLILIFTTVSILPQIIKIIRKKTSEGLSPTYLFLMVCNQIFATTNSTILNFPFMESCSDIGLSKCLPPLLSYFQFVSLVIMGFIEYTLFLLFYQGKHSLAFKRVILYYIIIILFFVFALIMVFISLTKIGICEPFTYYFAYVFGILSSVVTFVEYLPQLWKTFSTKSGGSMSLSANTFQTIGFLVVLCFMFFSTEQHVTTILSSVVSLIQHSLLVIMQIKYDYIDFYLCNKHHKKIESPDISQNEETKRLIDSQN
ncbi:PQ loop repeat protein [Entamoeba nuttalli P19]|uniref:PQ loop repeat protein n=1 Tax=Entamoeba nuttalli (strain P19) TaxID=1076696 RepID=K2H7F3_ENTNP|nr:PQ loop repeat protein [Entamoeba nuttalli P19]EKE38459.1 PQ loop repeat protein [Entamoeba nuttalli P19]|eukprot:XP_008859210.1 PQ loop repeat protein [Entamoeba nuttalli P19]